MNNLGPAILRSLGLFCMWLSRVWLRNLFDINVIQKEFARLGGNNVKILDYRRGIIILHDEQFDIIYAARDYVLYDELYQTDNLHMCLMKFAMDFMSIEYSCRQYCLTVYDTTFTSTAIYDSGSYEPVEVEDIYHCVEIRRPKYSRRNFHSSNRADNYIYNHINKLLHKSGRLK